MPPFSSSKVHIDDQVRNGLERSSKANATVSISRSYQLYEAKLAKQHGWFHVKYPNNARYIYVDASKYGIVWGNVIMFGVMHLYFFYALFVLFTTWPLKTWLFDWFFGCISGIGVTCGAHRLWTHRSYEAKWPLRALYCVLHTCAGQNDLYTWVRDHRLHHKFSETDADPHNSRRGMFFAHVGWLLTRKHPDVLIKGRSVDCSDLMEDPVVRIQRRHYFLFYLVFKFAIPMVIPAMAWGESWYNAFLNVFAQYIIMLHCTWFVNSAAHMLGDRPYNDRIEPRQNSHVNFASYGEGSHNYHHTFPWDYKISEMPMPVDPMTWFIELCARFGLAYNLKVASAEVVEMSKARVARATKDYEWYDGDHPYNNPHEF